MSSLSCTRRAAEMAKEAAENNLVGSIKELLSEVDLEALADEA